MCEIGSYGLSMDEARRVMERLERIEELRGRAAPPEELLAELRALLREGHDWAAAEGQAAAVAERPLERLSEALGSAKTTHDGEVIAGKAAI